MRIKKFEKYGFRNVKFSVRLAEADAEEFERIRKKEGRSRSDLFNYAVLLFMRQYQKLEKEEADLKERMQKEGKTFISPSEMVSTLSQGDLKYTPIEERLKTNP